MFLLSSLHFLLVVVFAKNVFEEINLGLTDWFNLAACLLDCLICSNIDCFCLQEQEGKPEPHHQVYKHALVQTF